MLINYFDFQIDNILSPVTGYATLLYHGIVHDSSIVFFLVYMYTQAPLILSYQAIENCGPMPHWAQ